VCAAAFAASVVSGSDGDPGSAGTGSTAFTTGAAVRGPIVDPRLSERVAARLDQGIPVVQDRLRDHASCRALFTRLGSDGAAELDSASYRPATAEQERKHCRRGVFAVTTVGGSAVVLCRSFARLSSHEAAIVLIHEALHLAGQAEYPAVPGAPDSHAITRMVMTGCRLF
jgi:hypothetical protein